MEIQTRSACVVANTGQTGHEFTLGDAATREDHVGVALLRAHHNVSVR